MARGSGCAKGAGLAAEAAAASKLADYAPAFAAGHLRAADFHPFAMEHGGRLSKSASALLHRLARLHDAKLTNLPPHQFFGTENGNFSEGDFTHMAHAPPPPRDLFKARKYVGECITIAG